MTSIYKIVTKTFYDEKITNNDALPRYLVLSFNLQDLIPLVNEARALRDKLGLFDISILAGVNSLRHHGKQIECHYFNEIPCDEELMFAQNCIGENRSSTLLVDMPIVRVNEIHLRVFPDGLSIDAQDVYSGCNLDSWFMQFDEFEQLKLLNHPYYGVSHDKRDSTEG